MALSNVYAAQKALTKRDDTNEEMQMFNQNNINYIEQVHFVNLTYLVDLKPNIYLSWVLHLLQLTVLVK